MVDQSLSGTQMHLPARKLNVSTQLVARLARNLKDMRDHVKLALVWCRKEGRRGAPYDLT